MLGKNKYLDIYLWKTAVVCCFFIIYGCNKITPIEMVHWVENESNGYRHVIEMGDMQFTLQESPPEYKLCIENKGQISKKDIDLVSKTEESEFLQFNLKIQAIGTETALLKYKAGSEEEYFSRLGYYVRDVEKDIYLIADSDTLYPVLCHFERNYHIAPYNTITFAIESNGKLNSKSKLVFYDRVFNKGPIVFRIRNKNKKLPKLKPTI
jgi:hypothetical protein